MQSKPLRFTASVTDEDGQYIARCLEIEVTAQGETIEDALCHLRESLELYFEDPALPGTTIAPLIAPADIEVQYSYTTAPQFGPRRLDASNPKRECL